MNKVRIELHTDNNYIVPTIVTLTSLFRNKNKDSVYEVRVLGNKLTPENTKLLEKCLGENGKVIPHVSVLSKFEGTHRHVSSTALFKFDLPDVLSDWDKVLYIDTDMIIQGDLSDLFDIDLQDNYIAAVKDMAGMVSGKHHSRLGLESYFNSGMMLMNLKKMRKDDIGAKLLDYKLHKDSGYFMDQDCLNAVFQEHVIYLSPIYNWMAPNQENFSAKEINKFYDLSDDLTLKNAIIVHLTNRRKPWDYIHVWGHDLWVKYYKVSILGDVKRHYEDKGRIFGVVKLDMEKVFYMFGLPILRIKKSGEDRRYIYMFGIKVLSMRKQYFLKAWKEKIRKHYINNRLKNCKYVHLMQTEKFAEPTVKFLNTYFNPKEHLYLCAKGSPLFDVPKISNVVKFNSIEGLNFDRPNIKKVICHGLFASIQQWLYEHPDISREKFYWIIWGFDLYDIPYDEKGMPKNERDLIIRQNFKGYITTTSEQEARKRLNLKDATFYHAFYFFPIKKEMIDKTHKEEHDYIQIQVNHSSNRTTLEMLDILSKWKDKNIRISTVLSYGDMSCVEEIKEKGKTLFGDKFFYLDHMLSAQEYTQFLAQNDIVILNHDRQQGMGNTIASLNLGTKIFIKSNVSTYDYLCKKMDIKVFDTYDIKDMSFEDFISYFEKEDNMKKAAQYYDDNYLAELWRKILES